MQNIVVKTQRDSTGSDSIGPSASIASSNLSWEEFAVLVRAEAEEYITTAQLDALKSDLPRWQKVLLDLLEDAEDKLIAVQQIKGSTREQVVNDFEAELNTLAVAFQRLKLVVEPGGAVALAAALFHPKKIEGPAVIAIISGGNVDNAVFTRALVHSS